jgi:hypothetical protein
VSARQWRIIWTTYCVASGAGLLDALERGWYPAAPAFALLAIVFIYYIGAPD